MPDEPILEDRRILELRYRMPILQIREFFTGLEEGKVRGTKCRDCGKIYFPPQSECSSCMTKNMEWIDFSGDATLETFTTVEVAPTSFAAEGKYVVAVGKLDEGINVLSWLNLNGTKDIKIGMKMKLKSVRKNEGYYSYEFFQE